MTMDIKGKIDSLTDKSIWYLQSKKQVLIKYFKLVF